MPYFLIFIVFLFNFAFADMIGQNSSGNNHFSLACDKNNDCTLILKNDITHKQVVFKQQGLAIMDKTNPIWHGENILELRTGFGTGLAYSNFINFSPFQLSTQFFNVSFIDSSKDIAIVENETQGYQYSMACLFNNKVSAITVLDDGVLDFGSFTPIGQDQVKFGYYGTGNQYEYKTINLNLNCRVNF
jgi:hypothetical protein